MSAMDIDFDDDDDLATLPLDRPSADADKGSAIEQLQQAWISERCAPDILPHETRLIDAISTRLQEQVRAYKAVLTG
jgi:hypothetical protein